MDVMQVEWDQEKREAREVLEKDINRWLIQSNIYQAHFSNKLFHN